METSKTVLNNLIDRLNEKREVFLDKYVIYLATYSSEASTEEAGLKVINAAGLLHDIDRHITNVHLELKRIEAIEALGIPDNATRVEDLPNV